MICIVVDFQSKNILKGCFEEGNYIKYTPMDMKKKYYLSNMFIIIKDKRDPYVFIYQDKGTLEKINELNSSKLGLSINLFLWFFAVKL